MLSVVRRLFTTSSSSSGTGTTAASAAASAAAAASSSSTNTTTTQTSSTAFAFKRKSFKSSAHIEANLDAERARATIERGVVLNMIEPEPPFMDESDWPVTPKDFGGDDDGNAIQYEPIKAAFYPQKRFLLDESSQQFASVAVGRRKTASARVMITPGKGDVFLNGRPLIDFVASYRLRDFCLRPLIVTETLGRFDVHAQTRGGGTSGQIGAVTHGLARALQNWDPDWRLVLKREKLLMRDERMVERKKTGQPKARKEWQWSKR